ncbi:MAG: M20 family peptidase [Sulfurifustaceae bacterium]
MSNRAATVKTARRILRRIAAMALLALVVVVGVNTVRQESRQPQVAAVEPLAIDEHAAAERLAGGVQIMTISRDDAHPADAGELLKLHAYLERRYPRAHAALKRERIGNYSLLYTWPGTDAGARGILLMAHQDVVPISPGTETQWQAPPFSGEIRDGFIWGRGTWDDKGNLFAILEAVELLVNHDFRPTRTVYLAFGHDEELGGMRGTHVVAAALRARGVRLAFVLDEGLPITEGVFPGFDNSLALIGVAEKGYVDVVLSLTTASGHSSVPPARTAIGRMSAALARIERNPAPAAIRGATREMFETLAPESHVLNRVLFSNLWLFAPLMKGDLERGAATNAMIRSTVALTAFRAGDKENVLPGYAQAVANIRLLPGDSKEQLLEHLKREIDDDDIALTVKGIVSDASRVSRTDVPSYRVLARTVRQIFPDAIVAPGLLVGRTDSRHMEEIADEIYRFSPVRARVEDLPRYHGINERISIANFADIIRFNYRLIRNAAGESPSD